MILSLLVQQLSHASSNYKLLASEDSLLAKQESNNDFQSDDLFEQQQNQPVLNSLEAINITVMPK